MPLTKVFSRPQNRSRLKPYYYYSIYYKALLPPSRLWTENRGAPKIERGEKTPNPKISALLRKRPVLVRANFVLTKDRKRPYYGHFCGKLHTEGSCSKAAGGP